MTSWCFLLGEMAFNAQLYKVNHLWKGDLGLQTLLFGWSCGHLFTVNKTEKPKHDFFNGGIWDMLDPFVGYLDWRCRFKELKKLGFTVNPMFSDRLYYSFFPDVFVDRPKYLFYCCMISQKLFGMLSGYFRHRCSHLLCRWKKKKKNEDQLFQCYQISECLVHVVSSNDVFHD